MERCSYFIQDKALFGSFPTQTAVRSLEECGVRYFLDLTNYNEKHTRPYITIHNYIKYPIADHGIPNDWKSFSQLVLYICSLIKGLTTGEKIYVHCKGGHGRSGIMVASILCQYYKILPNMALKLTNTYHSNRPVMRDKWRILGSPQKQRQRDFIHNFFKPIRYYSSTSLGNFSPYTVKTDLGVFPTAYMAFQAYTTGCEKMNMYKVLQAKFEQHTHLKENLINTGLRPLIKISQDEFWGIGRSGHGKNIHGRLLSILRNKYLLQ